MIIVIFSFLLCLIKHKLVLHSLYIRNCTVRFKNSSNTKTLTSLHKYAITQYISTCTAISGKMIIKDGKFYALILKNYAGKILLNRLKR